MALPDLCEPALSDSSDSDDDEDCCSNEDDYIFYNPLLTSSALLVPDVVDFERYRFFLFLFPEQRVIGWKS